MEIQTGMQEQSDRNLQSRKAPWVVIIVQHESQFIMFFFPLPLDKTRTEISVKLSWAFF